MNQPVRALVVEDDLEIQIDIEDVLTVLGHEHDWAQSQQEARELLEKNDYAYALVDLEIPARTGRGDARIDHGRALIEQIPRIKGRGGLPLILMTAHHQHGLNLTTELLGRGVMDFVAKPFGDGPTGRRLSEVIESVLEKHRHQFPNGAVRTSPPEPFQGGTLAFYADQIELNGHTIFRRARSATEWQIMQILRTPRPSGKLPRLDGDGLAGAIDPKHPPLSSNVTSTLYRMRQRIVKVMLRDANVIVGPNDVIANGGYGYHLAESLTIKEYDREAPADTTSGEGDASAPAAISSMSSNGAAAADDADEDRQEWILQQLRNGVKLVRTKVEEQFSVGRKQALRELHPLVKRGLIEFKHKPAPGHYALVEQKTGV